MALAESDWLRSQRSSVLRDEYGNLRPGVALAALAGSLAATVALSAAGFIGMSNNAAQERAAIEQAASDGLGMNVSLDSSSTATYGSSGVSLASYTLTAKETGDLVAVASVTSGDPALSMEVCPVSAGEFEAARQHVLDGGRADVSFVCVDAKWGVQGEPFTMVPVVTIVNKVPVTSWMKVSRGPTRYAGPAYTGPAWG